MKLSYHIYKENKDCLNKFIEIFKKFVKYSFEKILSKTEKDFPMRLKPREVALKTTYLDELLELNKVLSNLIHDAFEENNNFNSTLKEVLCDCQCTNEKYNCSYILPYSIHNAIVKYYILVKQDGRINEEYYDFITKCIFLFPCLPEKDIFIEIYKNLFCERTLKGNIMDFLYEEFILDQLKINCGIDFVSNLQDIITDLKEQNQINSNFSEYLRKIENENFTKKNKIDINVIYKKFTK